MCREWQIDVRGSAGSFLRAYVGIAGDVDIDEGAGEDGGLVWWLKTNVQHALALPDDEERNSAVAALAANFRRDR